MKKFILFVVVVVFVAMAGIYATQDSGGLVVGALMQEGKDIKEAIGAQARNARIENFRDACIRETQTDNDVQRAGMNVPAYCGCIADAHVNIDMSVADEDEKRQEFYERGEPCFEEYIRPAILRVCNQVKGRMDCACLYEYTVQEHVTMWIMGAEGKTESLTHGQREVMKIAFARRMAQECGRRAGH